MSSNHHLTLIPTPSLSCSDWPLWPCARASMCVFAPCVFAFTQAQPPPPSTRHLLSSLPPHKSTTAAPYWLRRTPLTFPLVYLFLVISSAPGRNRSSSRQLANGNEERGKSSRGRKEGQQRRDEKEKARERGSEETRRWGKESVKSHDGFCFSISRITATHIIHIHRWSGKGAFLMYTPALFKWKKQHWKESRCILFFFFYEMCRGAPEQKVLFLLQKKKKKTHKEWKSRIQKGKLWIFFPLHILNQCLWSFIL